MDWAKAAGFRAGENPVDGVAKGLPKQPDRKKHHAALPFEEMPSFIRHLRASDNTEPSKLAFEFLILTATRTDEVLGLPWSEIAGDVWTIPAERTKPKREHRVPLGSRCLEILRRARELSDGSDYIFPGQSRGKPLSNMVFLMALRRNESPVQGHGPLALLQRQRLLKTGYSTLTMTCLLMASKIITPVVPKQVGRSLTSSPERACWKRARKPTMFCLRAQFTPTV